VLHLYKDCLNLFIYIFLKINDEYTLPFKTLMN